MNSKTQHIDKHFPQNMNCAQTVFSLYASDLGIDEKTALKITSGFGGGMACAETCGAVTGSYMVIGMKHGHTSADPEEKANTKNKIMAFNEKFREKHGSLICKELTGYDISKPEEAEAAREKGVFTGECPKFIKTACEIIDENF
jgi:C_GCAxxG_C_C family probable redox protein